MENSDSPNSLFLKKFENEQHERLDLRFNQLTSRIVEFIQNIKSDEIYNAMKDSEYSKDYAVQRVKELFEESMNTEKEVYIEQLESEIMKNKEIIDQLQNNFSTNDSKFNGLQNNLKSLALENENLRKKLEIFDEKNKELCLEIESFRHKEKEVFEKSAELSMTQRKIIDEELEISRSQVFRLLREIENLKNEKENWAKKEFEYKNDHGELVLHIKSLQNDKKVLQNEIQQLSEVNFEIKEDKNFFARENENLVQKINQIEMALHEEIKTNKENTQKIMEGFREKSKKFKSKIIEQKKKIENLAEKNEKTQQDNERKVKEIEESLVSESLVAKELEIQKNKQQIEYNLNIESLKKYYESQMNSKIAEMQQEVDFNVQKCQDYEKNLKSIMENQIKSLELQNKELELNKQELMKQLNSALEGLENLRNAYSDQLNISQNNDYESQRLKNELHELVFELNQKNKKIAEIEQILAEDQEKLLSEHRIKCNLENQIRINEENIWKLKEELQSCKSQHKSVTINYENAINEYKNSLKNENSKFSHTLDRFKNLEDYSRTLESKLQTLQSDSLKNSIFSQPSLKHSLKRVNFQVQSIQQTFFDLKQILNSQHSSMFDYLKNILENITYKIIEKSAENRKLRSQVSMLKKENLSLTNSITNCSKEFDDLSKELVEKQKNLKENSKNIRDTLKEKFKEKYKKLEGKIQNLEKEKEILEIESRRTIEKLRDDLKYLHGITSRNIEDHTQCNKEVDILENRIRELEKFLDEERSQKLQLVELKNREIQELKERVFTGKKNEIPKMGQDFRYTINQF